MIQFAGRQTQLDTEIRNELKAEEIKWKKH